MQIKTEKTKEIKLYLSGPIDIAEQVIRKVCASGGLCVTISPTKYIYLGGEEQGYVVGLVNYPRFPITDSELLEKAEDLAVKLLEETYQLSVLIVTDDITKWISKRE